MACWCTITNYGCALVVSRYTEIPNRYPIFSNTDTDIDVGILNTENTENSVRYSPLGAVGCVTFETGQLNLSYYDIWSCVFSTWIASVYSLVILTSIWTVQTSGGSG